MLPQQNTMLCIIHFQGCFGSTRVKEENLWQSYIRNNAFIFWKKFCGIILQAKQNALSNRTLHLSIDHDKFTSYYTWCFCAHPSENNYR